MRGRFITIEGIEGVGKSSNMAVLVQTIQAAGFEVVTTREPGGTPLAEEIRSLLLADSGEQVSAIAELLLMFAARSLNVRNVIEPALREGKWVVCDRFTDSSRAYQGGGRELPAKAIEHLADWTHGDCNPDLTLLLDVPVKVGLERAAREGEPDRFEKEASRFFARVRQRYLDLAAADSARFRVIDASRPLDQVTGEVAAVVSAYIEDDLL